MPIDLSDRIIQPAKQSVKLHPLRRIVQIACGLLLVLIPVCNVFRIDCFLGVFWLFGQKYTATNIILLSTGTTIACLALLGVSMIYGRWWCGWICPQTLASDFGDSMKARIDRIFMVKSNSVRKTVASVLWGMSMAAISIATAAVVMSFFFAPNSVWKTVFKPLTSATIAGWVFGFAAFLTADLLVVRRKFCSSACPYGLFLSLVGDRNTMTVRYLWERDEDCIHCGQCVTLCPMGIDIKEGPNQMACIGCGECIDACNNVLPLLKKNPKPGLIELRYGVDPMRKMERLTPLQRFGLWDGRRVLVIATVLAISVGLFAQIYGTGPTTLVVSPLGFSGSNSRFIEQSYQVIIDNGKPADTRYSITLEGFPQASIIAPIYPVTAPRSGEKTITAVVSAVRSGLVPGKRYAMTFVAHSVNDSKRVSAKGYFYVPLPDQGR